MTRAQLAARKLARVGTRGIFHVTDQGHPDGRSYKASIPCPACGGTCHPQHDRLPARPFRDHLTLMRLPQSVVAERLGLSRRTLIRILHRDRLNICCAERYVAALGLSIYDVWGDEWL